MIAPARHPCGTPARYNAGCRCYDCKAAGRRHRAARQADPEKRRKHLAAQARYRAKFSESDKATRRVSRQQRRAEVRAYVQALKSSTPCADCGLSFPYYVLDFDHRPGEGKAETIARLVTDATLERVQAEIAKCDVVCSNCHRERTHQRASPGG